MPSRIAARSRGPPRPTMSRDSERARSGATLSRSRVCSRASGSLTKAIDGIEPPRNRIGIGQGRRKPLRQSREPAAVTVRSMAASSEPLRSLPACG